MGSTSSHRFNAIASNYATSEVHTSSPTLARLHALLQRIESVCDVASGAGNTGLSFAREATRIVAIDPAPKMLEEFRKLAAARGVSADTVEAFAESIPLPSESFDLVVCRLAAHHFTDVGKAVREMTRLAKAGGYVAVIDMEGDDDPELDRLNHDIEVLHDPTHVRSYTAARWRDMFAENRLEVIACEGRCWEISGGLTVRRWCELGNSGHEAMQAIQDRLAAAPPDWLVQLEITRDADGGFRMVSNSSTHGADSRTEGIFSLNLEFMPPDTALHTNPHAQFFTDCGDSCTAPWLRLSVRRVDDPVGRRRGGRNPDKEGLRERAPKGLVPGMVVVRKISAKFQ